jgi:hypothetical protein
MKHILIALCLTLGLALNCPALHALEQNSPELVVNESLEMPEPLVIANEPSTHQTTSPTRFETAPARNIELSEIDVLTSQRSNARYVLRCWQEGRLIVQRELARLPKQAQSAQAVELEDASMSSMQLFDLNNATCLVQKRR